MSEINLQPLDASDMQPAYATAREAQPGRILPYVRTVQIELQDGTIAHMPQRYEEQEGLGA